MLQQPMCQKFLLVFSATSSIIFKKSLVFGGVIGAIWNGVIYLCLNLHFFVRKLQLFNGNLGGRKWRHQILANFNLLYLHVYLTHSSIRHCSFGSYLQCCENLSNNACIVLRSYLQALCLPQGQPFSSCSCLESMLKTSFAFVSGF